MESLGKKFLYLEIDVERDSKIKLKDEELFFKVWRNVYIRNKCIFFHLRNFNRASKYFKLNFDSLREYQFKNYLTTLKIINDDTFFSNIDLHVPNKIIPYSVENLVINQNLLLKKGDLPDSINSLSFGRRFKEEISSGVLPKNLVKLRLGHNTKISSNFILPKTIKHLTLERNIN
ncbi:hypothetical protein RB653_002562 [Dictyostelium firmibasis]|uniref:Uncharacterized protein n=1 Tax=Dictyostelium firmibasis TaxID=79012 RepID=A0AAN7TQW9_9MYCE